MHMGFVCHLAIGTSWACTYVYVVKYRHRRLLHQTFFQVTQAREECSGENIFAIERSLKICTTVQWEPKKKKKKKKINKCPDTYLTAAGVPGQETHLRNVKHRHFTDAFPFLWKERREKGGKGEREEGEKEGR